MELAHSALSFKVLTERSEKMKILRPIMGFSLVVIVILVGFVKVAQWSVLLFGALYTAAYINGKWQVWRGLVQQRDRNFYQSLLATYAIETIIVFALYWLGRGTADLL